MDAALFRGMNRFAGLTPWLHAPMMAYAKFGIALFAIALAVAWWIARSRSSTHDIAAVVCAVLSVFAALVLAQLVGHVWHRPRPYDALSSVQVLVDRTTDFSFPSDHATAVGAVAAGLWFVHRRLGAGVALLALIMALARVYVGAHYPSDVLAGLALGAATAVLCHSLLSGRLAVRLDRLATTPLRALILTSPRR
jgi:undecaprenyl-diphosphatase